MNNSGKKQPVFLFAIKSSPQLLIIIFMKFWNSFYTNIFFILLKKNVTLPNINIKWSRYRPGVAQRTGRVIALLFHDRGTRKGWVVSSTLQPYFTPGKDPVPILKEAGWVPGSVWTGGKSRPHRDSIPDRPTRSQSLYRLSYPAHLSKYGFTNSKSARYN